MTTTKDTEIPMYEIDKAIISPASPGAKLRAYPIDIMEIGDSFLVPVAEKS